MSFLNVSDGKLHAVCDYDPDAVAAFKAAGLRWWPGRKHWVGKWTPSREDVVNEWAGPVEVVSDPDDYEARADRFQQYADNAAGRSSESWDRAHKLAAQIPFGQPILVGHHSEGRHRAHIKRIDSASRKGYNEYKKAEYWQDRANAAIRRAEKRMTPVQVARRIEKLEKERRKAAKYQDSEYKERWLWFYDLRLAYERALQEAVGTPDIPDWQKGQTITYGGTPATIKRVNPKTVSIVCHNVSGMDWPLKIKKDDPRLRI